LPTPSCTYILILTSCFYLYVEERRVSTETCTAEMPEILHSLPRYLLVNLPSNDAISKTLYQHISVALRACQDQQNKKMKQALSLLRTMLNDASCKEHHDFIYDVLLYFCNRMPAEIYPEDAIIPTEFMLLTIDQHCFDIRELANVLVIEDKALINPINKKSFHPKDQQRIFSFVQEKSLNLPLVENSAQPVSLAGFEATAYVVIKRDGKVVDFDRVRIESVIKKAMLASDVDERALDKTVEEITYETLHAIKKQCPNGGVIHIENIQNCVEEGLMLAGYRQVAHQFILYREERAKKRKEAQATYEPSIRIQTLSEGLKELDKEGLKSFLEKLAQGLSGVNCSLVMEEAYKNLYDGISYHDLNSSLIMVTRPLVEQEPNYSFFAARLLKHKLSEEALSFFQGKPIQLKDPGFDYGKLLPQYISKGIEYEYLNKALGEFNLEALSAVIDYKRDDLLSFFGLQTLYDRYFIHHKDVRIELPQLFFMRVAMGLALDEKGDKNKRAIEFYNQISTLSYMCATPTLFNSGTLKPSII